MVEFIYERKHDYDERLFKVALWILILISTYNQVECG